MEHVQVLWCMDPDERAEVWRRLGKFSKVEELVLGGENPCKCPMSLKEVRGLLEEGALAELQVLVLKDMNGIKEDVEEGLQAFLAGECLPKLEELSLQCELFLVFASLACKLA